MSGEYREPVESPEQALGSEGGSLAQLAVANRKFQPGFPGELHLGIEHEATGFPVRQEHAPEVEGVTRA
jgi:hypothetical protein